MHRLQIRAATADLAGLFGRFFKQDRQGAANLVLIKSQLLGVQQALQLLQARRLNRLIDLIGFIGGRCAGAR